MRGDPIEGGLNLAFKMNEYRKTLQVRHLSSRNCSRTQSYEFVMTNQYFQGVLKVAYINDFSKVLVCHYKLIALRTRAIP